MEPLRDTFYHSLQASSTFNPYTFLVKKYPMPLPFTLHFLTPWLSPDPFPELAGVMISLRYQAVLASTDSLTRRLEQLTGCSSLVRLENQQLQSVWEDLPEIWTPDYQITHSSVILTRNAWLNLGKRDLVFAYSQLTMTDLTETIQLAIEQGEQPLGSLFLARDEQVERQQVQLASAQAPMLANRLGLPENHPFVCRRSLFIVTGHLYGRILELFLTDLST